jgi:hypothetical protein
MGKPGKSIIFLIFSLFIFLIFICFSSKNNSKNTFSFEQFQSEMKAKNYNFEIQHVEEDFIPTTRERMKISKDAIDAIDIYLFSSNRKMEKDAKRIDSDGGGYSNGSKKVYVNWGLTPHFYKKGNIIVLYVGGNEKVISDLKEVFGEQFAGGK